MTELAAAVDEVLLGVGDDITEVRVQAVPRLPAVAELCLRKPAAAEGKLLCTARTTRRRSSSSLDSLET